MSGSGGTKGYRSSRLLRINSKNKLYGTDTNFVVDIGNCLQLVNTISFVSCTFPNNFYNVIGAGPRQNNVSNILIDTGSGTTSTSITITPGWYTVSTLTDAMTTAFAALTPSVTTVFNYDPITNRVGKTLTNIGYTVTATKPSGQFSWLFELLGSVNAQVIINSTQIRYGENAPQMGGEEIVYIQSSTLAPGNAMDEKGLQFDIALPVVVNAPFGSLNVFECKQDHLCEIIYVKPRNLSNIDIRLVDHEGNLLDLHGGTLNIEMRVWFNTY